MFGVFSGFGRILVCCSCFLVVSGLYLIILGVLCLWFYRFVVILGSFVVRRGIWDCIRQTFWGFWVLGLIFFLEVVCGLCNFVF